MTHHHPHHAHDGHADEERPATYAEQVEAQRAAKDAAFRTQPWSPIAPQDRNEFPGLHYYPPDPAWRFGIRLTPHAEPKTLQMQTSTGDAREYRNVGHFTIRAEGQDVDVQAYLGPEGQSLFIPFRDRTSGKETYGAGRYLDLEWEGLDAEYALDFNLAYNPYCAYNEDFSCPLPPPENWLPVQVPAGEKSWE